MIRGWSVKNTKHPPGQITATEYKPTHGDRPEFTADNGHTLGDYLHGKYPQVMKKKLTFEEWFLEWTGKTVKEAHKRDWPVLIYKKIWDAGQENK
jgi:hypothetical protein